MTRLRQQNALLTKTIEDMRAATPRSKLTSWPILVRCSIDSPTSKNPPSQHPSLRLSLWSHVLRKLRSPKPPSNRLASTCSPQRQARWLRTSNKPQPRSSLKAVRFRKTSRKPAPNSAQRWTLSPRLSRTTCRRRPPLLCADMSRSPRSAFELRKRLSRVPKLSRRRLGHQHQAYRDFRCCHFSPFDIFARNCVVNQGIQQVGGSEGRRSEGME